jgi:hypothetical protein
MRQRGRYPNSAGCLSIFKNFQYSDLVAGHEISHGLIFRADVGSVTLHGVDYLRMTTGRARS